MVDEGTPPGARSEDGHTKAQVDGSSAPAARVRELFHAALDRPESELSAFLDQASKGDPALREELERLIALHAAADDDEEGQTLHQALNTEHFWVGRTIDNVTVESIIATGGMGTVYKGVQESPRRDVAVKILREAIPSERALRRFEFEAQTLARLNHPGITHIYAAGTFEDRGVQFPYFIMELITGGQNILEYADAKQHSLRQKIKLFEQICSAIGYAHQRGIIHRDLKPGNVLIDAHGNVQVIDFGIARSMDKNQTRSAHRTLPGEILGTLAYMSPEQFSDPDDVDARSDVYALGILMYELLVKQKPYEVAANISQAQRVIADVEPRRPSLVDRRVRGDIETILLKALEKDRERRYRDANEIHDDIERYLAGQPVSAQPPTPIYTLKKVIQRNRTSSAALASVIIGLFVTTIVLVIFNARERELLVVAQRNEEAANSEAWVFTQLLRILNTADINAILSTPEGIARPGETILRELVYRETPEKIELILEDSPLAAIKVAGSFAKYARHSGDHESELKFAEIAMRATDLLNPTDPLTTIQSKSALAMALSNLGNHREAQELLEQTRFLVELLARNEDREVQSWYLLNQMCALEEIRSGPEAALVHLEELHTRARRLHEMYGRGDTVDWARRRLTGVLNELGRHDEAFALIEQNTHVRHILDRSSVVSELRDHYPFEEAAMYITAARESERHTEANEMIQALRAARTLNNQIDFVDDLKNLFTPEEERRQITD
jgi:serine/threonine protein kinase